VRVLPLLANSSRIRPLQWSSARRVRGATRTSRRRRPRRGG
jgi:hypothetical protein